MRDARDIAREIAHEAKIGIWTAINPANGSYAFVADETAIAAIALAIEQDRAETIERCAKVAEANAPRNEPGRYWDGRFAAADDIRRDRDRE